MADPLNSRGERRLASTWLPPQMGGWLNHSQHSRWGIARLSSDQCRIGFGDAVKTWEISLIVGAWRKLVPCAVHKEWHSTVHICSRADAARVPAEAAHHSRPIVMLQYISAVAFKTEEMHEEDGQDRPYKHALNHSRYGLVGLRSLAHICTGEGPRQWIMRF